MGKKKNIENEEIDLANISNEDVLVDGNFFKGNENLLRGSAQIKWTSQMIEEIKTCNKKILHFAENYFFITTLDEGKQKIELRKYQKRLLKAFANNRFNVVLSSRQSGKTTTITIYALWMVCFQNDKRITIVANKEDTAKEIFARIKMAFEQLPIWMKPSVKSWRKDGFQLENDSAITVSSTSSAGPRGSSSNLLIIDEMAHCQPDLMRELWKSAIPIISSSKKSQLVIISTPNGVDNKFYDLYKQSQEPNSEWHLERVDWWEVPGRDENWKKEAIDAIGSKEDFDQEYGNVFHEKGKTAIDPELLEQLKSQCREPILVMDNGDYKIFTEPNPESFYAIGVDVSEGIGRSNTVAQILDFSDLTKIKQVAIYSTNQMSPFHFGTRLMGILDDWGRPPILVENNNNGQQVLDVLCQTHNYESVVSYQFDGMSKHYNRENRFGIHNHTNTRYRGVTNFRYWTNSLKALELYDIDTLLELSNFVRHPNFTFSKRKDEDLDDRVLSLIWALFILDPAIASKYYNIIENDDQGRPLKIKPLIDNSDLIKKSPLFYGQVSGLKKNILINKTYSFVGKLDEGKDITYTDDAASLMSWISNWGNVGKEPPSIEPINKDKIDNKDKLYNGEEWRPSIII
jgi:Terminase large subunit, T4likevirus-type, N-terminal